MGVLPRTTAAISAAGALLLLAVVGSTVGGSSEPALGAVTSSANAVAAEPVQLRTSAATTLTRPVFTGPTASTSRVVYLTYDDGPSRYTPKILDLLKAYRANATFFVVGSQVRTREATLRRIRNDGHLVGNHSWNHPLLTRLSPAQVRSQFRRTDAAITAHDFALARSALLGCLNCPSNGLIWRVFGCRGLRSQRATTRSKWCWPTCGRRLSPRKSRPFGRLTLRCGPLYIVGLARRSGCLPGPFTAMQHKRRIAVVALESGLRMVMIAARSCGATAPAGNSR